MWRPPSRTRRCHTGPMIRHNAVGSSENGATDYDDATNQPSKWDEDVNEQEGRAVSLASWSALAFLRNPGRPRSTGTRLEPTLHNRPPAGCGTSRCTFPLSP